jgi:phosphoribosyl-AMP cyclohydrolase / phosphoribosyl-ATP pyrophosphohydrolase
MPPLTFDLDSLDFARNGGAVTVVTQDADTGVVLMVAAANREALERTVASGEMHYTSRTRGLWHKGATSGNRQHVVSLSRDCDGDTVLARVRPLGPACHTGAWSCFGGSALGADAVGVLDGTIASRAVDPSGSGEGYTRRLLRDRNLRLKKLGEEAAEFIMACADADSSRAVAEASDLVYHALVALHAVGADWPAVVRELGARRARDVPPAPVH